MHLKSLSVILVTMLQDSLQKLNYIDFCIMKKSFTESIEWIIERLNQTDFVRILIVPHQLIFCGIVTLITAQKSQ